MDNSNTGTTFTNPETPGGADQQAVAPGAPVPPAGHSTNEPGGQASPGYQGYGVPSSGAGFQTSPYMQQPNMGPPTANTTPAASAMGSTPPPPMSTTPPTGMPQYDRRAIPSMPPEAGKGDQFLSSIASPPSAARPVQSRRQARPAPIYQPTSPAAGEQSRPVATAVAANTGFEYGTTGAIGATGATSLPGQQPPIGMNSSQQQPTGVYGAQPSYATNAPYTMPTGSTQESAVAPGPTGSNAPLPPVAGRAVPAAGATKVTPSKDVASSVPMPQKMMDRYEEPIVKKAPFQAPPLSSVYPVSYLDVTNCSPNYMRSTLYMAPASQDLLRSSGLPFGIVVQPLAPRMKSEGKVPVVDYGPEGPIRCRRCHGYINFGVKFHENGRRWHCNLCGCINDLPEKHICSLDANGMRKDHMYRMELCHGTVDFVATDNFASRKVGAVKRFFFFIDASAEAVRSGVFHSLCEVLKSMIPIFKSKNLHLGVATFDSAVHFYDLSGEGEPKQMVCSDVDEPFVPSPSGLVVPVDEEHGPKLMNLLSKLPEIFKETTETRACSGAAASFGHEILKETGGTVCLSLGSIPTHGAGVLASRFDPNKSGSEEQIALFKYQGKYYTGLGKRCAEDSVCINLFVFPEKKYIDARTIGVLSQMTGGQMNMYPLYVQRRDISKLQKDVYVMLTRDRGTDAIMKMRCSTGFHVEEIVGNFHLSSASEMEMILPSVDADKSFLFDLKHDEKLKENESFTVQLAMLYTAADDGRRLIRVHTLTMGVTEAIGALYNKADLDAIVNVMARKLLTKITTKSLESLAKQLVENCTKILVTYRKECSTSPVSAHLVLPEALKYLPLYVMCLKKSIIFRQTITPAPIVPIDWRTFHINTVMTLGCKDFISFIYPSLYRIFSPEKDVLDEKDGTERNGFIITPKSVEPSSRVLFHDSVMLLDNYVNLYLWFGRNVPGDVIESLLGLKTLSGIDTSKLTIPTPTGEYEIGRKLHGIIKGITLNRGITPLTRIIYEGNPDEFLFLHSLMFEKITPESSTYLDFLVNMHKQILEKISQ